MRKDKANDLWRAITAYANAFQKYSLKESTNQSVRAEDEALAIEEFQRAEGYLIESFQFGTGWRPARETSGWRLTWGLTSKQPDRPTPGLFSPTTEIPDCCSLPIMRDTRKPGMDNVPGFFELIPIQDFSLLI